MHMRLIRIAAPVSISVMLALLLGGCASTKEDVFPKNMKPMSEVYDEHFSKLRTRGIEGARVRLQDERTPLPAAATEPELVDYTREARAGEPVTFDPLNRQDRKKNAHMLIVGPTGSGKSATVNGMLLHALAVHRPRIFIIDAGRSFDLFGAHCASLGLSVHQVVLDPSEDVSLPPFVGALKLCDQPLACDTGLALEEAEEAEAGETEEGASDPLGQMELAARIMVTGGEDDVLHRLSRAGRLALRKAILKAAEDARRGARTQVLTEDVAHALRTLPDLEAHRRAEAEEMAEGLELFCTGLQGHFFNRAGRPWQDADVTILELGFLAREGYEDSLSVAYTSIMSHIQDLVERRQREGRTTIVVNDEAHLITLHPLLAPYHRQGHSALAQVRGLVLGDHPQPRGLPRTRPAPAQHDGVVALPGP